MPIAIGIRERGPIGYNDFWHSLVTIPKPDYYLVTSRGYSAPEAARDVFRKSLAHKDVTHVWLLDDDGEVAPGTLERLMSRNLPVVTSLFFTSTLPPRPVVFRGVSGTWNGQHPAWLCRDDDLHKWLDHPKIQADLDKHVNDSSFVLEYDGIDMLSRADAIGFHCSLIRRDVLEAIGEPYCEGLANGLREDFDFSERAIKVGVDMYVDKSVITGHFGVIAPRPFDYYVYEQIEMLRTKQEADKNGKEKVQEG